MLEAHGQGSHVWNSLKICRVVEVNEDASEARDPVGNLLVSQAQWDLLDNHAGESWMVHFAPVHVS